MPLSNSELEKQKRIQESINKAMEDGNDVAKGLGSLLQEQLQTSKELNATIEDRAKVLNHLLSSEKDIENLLSQYSLSNKLKLPWIYHTDPQAKWLGLKQGDIVRITSYNSNSGTYYRYRCCV